MSNPKRSRKPRRSCCCVNSELMRGRVIADERVTENLKQLERSLQMRSSLLVVSLAALLALMSGCSTVKTGDSFVSDLPKNTIVVRNGTKYTLTVLRNGVVWKRPDGQGRKVYQLPLEVMPHQELVLYEVTSQPSERVMLGLDAIEPIRSGCLVGTRMVGSHCFRVLLGTNNPPILVTVRSTGF